MSIATSISRFAEYYRRHGMAATLQRMRGAVRRMLFAGRMALFYCDLDNHHLSSANLSSVWKVRQLRARADLTPEHLRQMTEFWNPRLATKNINDRFARGASLWLVDCEGRLAGYGWTLQGTTMEPYYFPLASDDVHLFDFNIFPQYRGRGLNPFLVDQILCELASQHAGRAFIEAAEWNHAQLASLEKTRFRRLGTVRSFRLMGHTLVFWTEIPPPPTPVKSMNSADPSLRIAGSREQ